MVLIKVSVVYDMIEPYSIRCVFRYLQFFQLQYL